ncbi:hypothetical protein Tco_1152817 [Tanacetum coccineum]
MWSSGLSDFGGDRVIGALALIKHQRYIAGEELSDPESPTSKPAKLTKQTKPKATEQSTVSKSQAKDCPKPARNQTYGDERKPVSEVSEAHHIQSWLIEFVMKEVLLLNPVLKTQRRRAEKGLNTGENFNLYRGARKGEGESREDKQPTDQETSSLYAELGLSGSDTESDEERPSEGRSGNQDGGQAGLDHGTLDEGQAGSDPGTRDEGQAGSNPGTLDEGQAGSGPGTRDEGQAGPNPDDTNIAESLPLPTPSVLAGPDLELSVVEITGPSSQPQPEHMDEGFTASAYPDVHKNLKLTVDEQVIPEEPVSSTGTLSSLQHLAKDFSFGDQFLNDKPSEADNEKTTADTEAESMASFHYSDKTFITLR